MTAFRRRDLATFHADARDFAAELARSRARMAPYEVPVAVVPPESLAAVVHELRVQQEELSVAEEELRAQLEELARATDRAHAERDRYRALFDDAPDACFVTDRLGVIRDVNLRGAEITNVAVRFLIGKPLTALIDIADARLFRTRMVDLREQSCIAIDLRLQPRGGEPTWCALRASVVNDGAGILWVARDIRARHDEASARHRSYLDVGGADTRRRIAALERANRDNGELLQRERRLREELVAADAAKDRLIAVLSHDLRGPLHGVLGWTGLLRREILDARARDRALVAIEDGAREQVRLLDELLDVSRVASEAVQLERVSVDLSRLAQEVVAALSAEAAEHAVTLTPAISRGIVVMGDRGRLRHLLRKVLARALASAAEGGTIELVAEVVDGHARVVLHDDGRGIAPKPTPALALHGPSPAIREGLSGDAVFSYLVRRIVELHDGTVVAASDDAGAGSRLTFTVPLPGTVRNSSPPPPARALTGMRVLVVDADADARELMTMVLEAEGALVASARSADEALLVFDAAPLDALVTELALPGQDGIQLMRRLGARPASTTAFVLISGHHERHDAQRALDAGFDACLTKPIDSAALVTTLEELTANAAADR